MTIPAGEFYVVLFYSVAHAIKAEKLLKEAGISIKTIPVPRHISADCGVCLRFEASQKEAIESILSGGNVDVSTIVPL
jgi:hypothetical protein